MTGKNKRSRKSKKSFFRWQNWKKVVAVLAGVAVFATTYALILPAITLEGDTACGLEEHVHSEEAGCYETVLACGIEEGEDHTHTDECYTLELVCTQEEHTHTDECYVSDNTDESDEGDEEYAYSITGTSEDGLYTVTVSYSDEAGIPEDSVLEINLSDKEYDDETLEEILEIIYASESTGEEESTDAENEDEDDILSAASTSDDSSSSDEASEDEDASGETSSASVISSVSLDISIVSEDEEIEPASAVEITITSADTISVDEGEDFSVIGISDEEITLVEDAELEENEEAGTSTVTFEAESVSDSEYDLMVTAENDPPSGGGGDTGGGPGGGNDGNNDDDDDNEAVSYYHIDVRIDGTINYSTSTTKGETDITVTKVWDDDESTHNSVTVYLLDSNGNKVLASSVAGYDGEEDNDGYIIAILSENNNWTYTWEDIDLEAGSYSVEEEAVSGYVTAYENNSVTVTDTGEDSSYEYTGTLTVTSLTSVTVKDADTGETMTVEMNNNKTKDENSSTTTYEYQSTAGHSGDDDTVLLEEGDTITLVLSFTYSYTDSDGNVISGTVEDFTYTVVVDDDDNVCDGESGKTNYGFDIEISAEYLLEAVGAINDGTVTITNTKLPDIQIKKVSDSDDTVLGGAVFTLSKVESETTYYYTEDGDWSSNEDEAEKFNTDDGTGLTSVISGLEYDTYYLTEVTAPDGYIALTDSITITVTADGVTAYYGGSSLTVTEDSNGTYVITVTNSAGYELPETGGPGVWWLWTLGILVIGFVLLIAKRESMLGGE